MGCVCSGIKIRAGQGTAPLLHPAPVQQKYVHPNAARAGRSGYAEDLLSPGRQGGNLWRGGHSSVSSLVVGDAAVGDESSSWQSLSEGSDRSISSEINMISPVAVGKREGFNKPVAGPGPGQPPRAIPNSPGSASSQSCGPPLDQLLPSQSKDAVPKVSVSVLDAPEAAAGKGPAAKDSYAGKTVSASGSGETCVKPAGPLRMLSLNSDRSHSQQGVARSASVQPTVQSKGQKVQSGSQASGESSYKAAAKQLSQVRTEAPLSSSAAQQQPASKPRSPQKRSMAPTLPFTTFAPSQSPASMAAWSHLHLQQRSPHMHMSPSMGLTSMDTQRMMDVQRQMSAADIVAYSASMRAPVRTQSLPRLQQEAASTSRLHQQRQSGHAGQGFEPQRQAVMQQMSQMPPSWRQSPQPSVDGRQLQPKHAGVHSAGGRASRTGGVDMHVPRRHSVPASPVISSHSGPFPFHPHSEAPPLHQLMQQALSHNGFSSQGQPSKSMGIPAGQMPGYPAVRPRPSPYAEPHLQRHMMHSPAVSRVHLS